jgi:hypothetical protein
MDQLSPLTLIGGVIALFTILGFLKRFVSFFFNLVALSLGAIAGLWAYNNGFEIAQKAVDKPQPWMSTAIGNLNLHIHHCRLPEDHCLSCWKK